MFKLAATCSISPDTGAAICDCTPAALTNNGRSYLIYDPQSDCADDPVDQCLDPEIGPYIGCIY
jgi:hypothetical protein